MALESPWWWSRRDGGREEDLKLLVVLSEDGVHLRLVDIADILAALDSIEPDDLVAAPTAIDHHREGVPADTYHPPQHLNHLGTQRLPHLLVADTKSGLATASQALDSQGSESHDVELSAVDPSPAAVR
jgi:hypothetical protein